MTGVPRRAFDSGLADSQPAQRDRQILGSTDQSGLRSVPVLQDRLLDIHAVCERVGFGFTTVYKRIRQGQFPKPRRIFDRSRWSEREIEDWVKALPTTDEVSA